MHEGRALKASGAPLRGLRVSGLGFRDFRVPLILTVLNRDSGTPYSHPYEGLLV